MAAFSVRRARCTVRTRRASELVPDGPDVTAAELDRARQLRAALRALAQANHDGEADPAATSQLNELVPDVALDLRFTPDGELELGSAADGVTGVLGALVAATAAAVVDDTWRRMKLCGNDRCGWAFYDGSRNRSARWCSMAVCGNRMKASTFRSRHD
jgi:predicted RNA-binding Zn ribbon-like protein